MNNSDNIFSEDRDYVLSCTTLFSHIGFPKAAFIKMIGQEYASDIFELVNDGKLIMQGNIFKYPHREKRKKRINKNAQLSFYRNMMHELQNATTTALKAQNPDMWEAEYNMLFINMVSPSTCSCSPISNAALAHYSANTNTDAENKTAKYHRNLGRFIAPALERSIAKIPLDKQDTICTYNMLGWYYIAIGDYPLAQQSFDCGSTIS